MSIEHLPDVVTHKLHHLKLDTFPFCLCGKLFHIAGVLTLLFVIAFIAALSALFVACQQTMYHRVRVATDRTGEMGIVRERESEVSDIVNGVFSFHHGSQGNGLNQFLLTPAL